MSIQNSINHYNNTNISNNITKLNEEINKLSNKQLLDKGKTIQTMYQESEKLEKKEHILFIGTSILTIIVVIGTYKILMK